MKLNLPKMRTFWIAVGIAVVSIIVYIVHVEASYIPLLGAIGFVLLLAAFALLCLSLIVKGL
jgi:uncharacterized membrane protein